MTKLNTIKDAIIQKALLAPITHRNIIENMVCPKCKERLNGLFRTLQTNETAAVVDALSSLEIAYLLGRKGIKSNTERKLRETLAFSWKKS